MEIRLLQPTDGEKYWDLRLDALKQNPEAFATEYDEARQRFDIEGRGTYGG